LLLEGWLALTLNEPDLSKKILSQTVEISKTENTALLAKYFAAIYLLKEGSFEEFIEYTDKLIQGKGFDIEAPNLKYQSWATLYYSLKDNEKAAARLTDLKMTFPGSLLSYPESGSEIFKKTMPGEILVAFNVLTPLIPKAVHIFKIRVGLLAQRLKEDEFVRFYTQDEFNHFILARLKRKMPKVLKRATVAIHESGFDGEAILKLGFLEFPFRGAGFIGVDAEDDNSMYLEAHWVKVGPFKMPRFLLKNLEATFYDAANKGNLPLEILEMTWEDGGILIKCKKIDQGGNKTGLSHTANAAHSKGEFAY